MTWIAFTAMQQELHAFSLPLSTSYEADSLPSSTISPGKFSLRQKYNCKEYKNTLLNSFLIYVALEVYTYSLAFLRNPMAMH